MRSGAYIARAWKGKINDGVEEGYPGRPTTLDMTIIISNIEDLNVCRIIRVVCSDPT